MKTLTAIVISALVGVATACGHEKHEHPPGPGLFGQPPEYVHVLLNPLPIYGLALGILGLGAALLARSKSAQAITLGIVVISAASEWPVQYYGENAYQRVRQISDMHGQHWLDEHMKRAESFGYAFYAVALMGVAALISLKRFPKAATPLTIITLVASVAALSAGAWIGKAGGQIRHAEFRSRTAPSTTQEAHKHGASDPMPMHPPATPDGHRHEGAGERAQQTLVPDTLEAVWKVIHEHHRGLEAGINEKRFADVRSDAERISALTKRLIELAHPDHKPAVQSGVTKVDQALTELKASAETGSELVMKNSSRQFETALHELEQQMKKQ
ncbi:MAG: hypothetical protein L0Y58_15950 [Verrucomicrobia subdivision 3 bacterium]|nr:hypothetical protein [Limisphaerales bacterium]